MRAPFIGSHRAVTTCTWTALLLRGARENWNLFDTRGRHHDSTRLDPQWCGEYLRRV